MYKNIIKISLIFIFFLLQVLTHSCKGILSAIRRQNKLLSDICNNYLQKHLSEEQISFIFAFIFIIILFFIHKPKRFTSYIIDKYENLIISKFYKKKMKEIKKKDVKKCQESCCCSCGCYKINSFAFIKKIFSKILLPISPFSSKNPFETVAIYIIYTYDILNIFTYVYSSVLVVPIFKMIRNKGGILTDFLLQIMHVLVIGLKFYPLLAITDIKETWYTNLIAFLYTLLIWILKLINKGLCSRTEVFVQLAFSNIDRLQKVSREQVDKFNLASLLNKVENEESKYDALIQVKIPELFNETFKEAYSQSYPDWLSIENPVLETIITTSTVQSTLQKPSGYRKYLSNATNQYANRVFDELYNDEDTDIRNLVRSLLENLPLYFSLSYLLGSYMLSLIYCLKKIFRSKIIDYDRYTLRILKKEIRNISFNKILRTNSKCNLCNDKYLIDEVKIQNPNYDYIEKLIQNNGKVGYYDTRFSKQFIYTYTVAFMVVYFFTVFLFRISNIFGSTIIKIVEFFIQLLFSNDLDTRHLKDLSILDEFRIAYILTSIISVVQLVQSIFAFEKRVKQLNHGVINPNNDRNNSYFLLNGHKRSEVVRKSLHFSGYLIAHLVYGYIILLFVTFIIILAFRLVYYLPFIVHEGLQFLLPIILMILLKSVFLRSIIYSIFECRCCKRVQNLTAYSTLSYFNFFFDCFLGFMSCVNRIWKTTLISVFYVVRLDVSIFNENNDIILKSLDKGHVAYLNFSYMEHSYNNQVVNGFCEILIESMFQSFIYQENLENPFCECDIKEQLIVDKNEPAHLIASISDSTRKYESYSRLRKLLFFYYTVKRFPSLSSYIGVPKKKPFPRLQSIESEEILTPGVVYNEELPNFNLTNEQILNFFNANRNSSNRKFKINNEFICLYTTNKGVLSNEIGLINEIIQFTPSNGGKYEINNQVSITFINTCTIDYFLYAVWLTTQNLSINLFMRSNAVTNDTYKLLADIADCIEGKNWDKAKYLWLKTIIRIDESSSNVVNCFGTLKEFFISKMNSLQCYRLQKTCTVCELTEDPSYGNELWFKEENYRVLLDNVNNVVDVPCQKENCRGVLRNRTNFVDSAIWIIVEFTFNCPYSRVPLEIKVDTDCYELVCCITSPREYHFASIFYLHKSFYLIDDLKPKLVQKATRDTSKVQCAIYTIKL
jgi:hypothetical protein